MSTGYLDQSETEEVIRQFAVEGKLVDNRPYGNGHINDTYLLTFDMEQGREKKYILQQMNGNVFRNPKQLMENVVRVTEYLRDVITAQGGDPDRETLNVIRTLEGDFFYEDENHDYWRMYLYVEGTLCLEKVENKNNFHDSGVAFGRFQKMLSDFPVEKLWETIPDFHNTPVRFLNFRKAVQEDRLGRAAGAEKEIQFVLSRKKDVSVLTDLLGEGKLPLRVTHNDTKLNNVLFDRETGKVLCVIDLDTVMPGLSLYDFGDSIRFGASTGAEDEQDLDKVRLDLELFEAFTKGYLEGCGGSLTEQEISMLPMGAKLMTLECGMRFLADYLEGDNYFKIHRERHNLDRARTQFKLVEEMESRWDELDVIVQKCKR
nr:aminoglycoside phosphotransferase family protein [uncultured Acetatifactor sp.]